MTTRLSQLGQRQQQFVERVAIKRTQLDTAVLVMAQLPGGVKVAFSVLAIRMEATSILKRIKAGIILWLRHERDVRKLGLVT